MEFSILRACIPRPLAALASNQKFPKASKCTHSHTLMLLFNTVQRGGGGGGGGGVSVTESSRVLTECHTNLIRLPADQSTGTNKQNGGGRSKTS